MGVGGDRGPRPRSSQLKLWGPWETDTKRREKQEDRAVSDAQRHWKSILRRTVVVRDDLSENVTFGVRSE